MSIGENSESDHKVSRQSGIELLRILTICGVILLHYNDGRAFVWVEEKTVNQYVLMLIESICICAVDLFMIISGYFLCKSQKRKAIKPLELLAQVILVSIIAITFEGIKNRNLPLKSFAAACLPKNYFVTLYIVIYILSPWINILLTNINSKQLRKLVGSLIIAFSIFPTIADVLEEVIGKELMGINTVGAWGAQQGFTVVNFMLCYVIGAFINLYEIKIQKRSFWLGIYAGATLLVYVWSMVCEYLKPMGLRSSWEYCNPLVILQAVSLFLIFKNFTFQNSIVNKLAKSVFVCYLIHSYFLSYIRIDRFVQKTIPVMVLHMILSAVGIYLVCWIVWLIYDMFTRKMVRNMGVWLEQKRIDFSVNMDGKETVK